MTRLLDARELPEATRVETDLCIIGAGAAGITLARSLIGHPVKVCLLESGGLEFEPATQDLYAGRLLGHDAHPPDASRLRYFGGSTNHWNGHIRPLGVDDFEQRPWLRYSGWPFPRSELDGYYRPAADVVQILGSYHWQPDGLEPHLQAFFRLPGFRANDELSARVFHHSPPTRFGEAYREELIEAPNVDVYLHANLVGFITTEDGRRVTELQVRTLSGRAFTVLAQVVVLATGGIENARLLLAASRTTPALGNRHDLVGRFFLDHPISALAQLHLFEPSGLFRIPPSPTGTGAMLSLSAAARGRERLSRMVLRFWPVTPPSIVADRKGYESLRRVYRRLKRFVSSGEAPERVSEDLLAAIADLDGIWRYRLYLQDDQPSDTVTVEATMEQVPNPESRVRLGREVDALGMPRVLLDWRFTADDMRFWKRNLELLGQQIAALGVGRLKVEDWVLAGDPASFEGTGSYHPSGTTRMSDNPRQGVVDSNGRVHGVDNLYVAGSSIFPTIGDANPTLTIVALTLRLADHLRTRFQAA